MRTNVGFRVGTSSRRVTKYSMPRLGGPKYIVVGAHDRVLVLEDLLPRILKFQEWLGSSAKIVNTAPKAIQELQRQFDVVFLDRDLGLNAGHGEDVAAELVRMNFAGAVVCHSANSFGAALIEKTLRDGGISNVEAVPFDLLAVLREK
jgi:Cyclic-phosphate processing Receiver domain